MEARHQRRTQATDMNEAILAQLLREKPWLAQPPGGIERPLSDEQEKRSMRADNGPGKEIYNFGSAAALSGSGLTSLLAEGLRQGGYYDEPSVIEGVPDYRPELEDIPYTWESNMREVGADPYAIESLVGSFADPATGSLAMVGALKALAPTRNLKKTKVTLGRMWDDVNDYDEALELARQGAHLKRDKTGQYIGAPRGIDTPQKLQKLRERVDAKVGEGIKGAGWYDEARDTAEALSPDPNMQKQFARGTAAYSPQATPGVEVGHFAKQHNTKMLTGEDIQPRTDKQGWNVAESYTDDGIVPENIVLADKTGPYADAKDPTIPDETLYKTANDIWHGRAWEYDGGEFDRGFSAQEHGFLTGENLLLAERAGQRYGEAGHRFTPRSAQAATWIRQRKQDFIDKRLAAAKKKGQELDPAELDAEAEKYALSTIGGAVNRNSAYITSEARTGAGVNHLPMDDPELIAQYTNQVQKIAQRDPVMEGLNIYHKDATPTKGRYLNSLGELEENPGFAHQVLVGTDIPGGPNTMPADQAALDYSALLGGVLRSQEAGAWSRFLPQNMGQQKVKDLNAVLMQHGPEGVPPIEGVDTINWGDDLTMGVKFGDEGPIQGNVKELQKALRDYPGEYYRGRAETGYEPTYLTAEPGSGEATRNLLRAGDESPIVGLEERTADAVAKQAAAMNELDRMVSSASGLPVREDIMKMRDILAQGGVPALREYVRKYGAEGLPAVLLAVLFGRAETGENDAESPL